MPSSSLRRLSMIVMKFGGSSMATSDALTRVLGVIGGRVARRPVVVVSAIGGTTDRLLAAVEQATQGQATAARRLVAELRDDLLDTVAPVLSGWSGLPSTFVGRPSLDSTNSGTAPVRVGMAVANCIGTPCT